MKHDPSLVTDSPYLHKNNCGFGIVAALVVLVIISVAVTLLVKSQDILSKQNVGTDVTLRAQLITQNFSEVVSNSSAWTQTFTDAANNRSSGPTLDCLVPSTSACTTSGSDLSSGGTALGMTNVNRLKLPDGSVYFDFSNPANGISLDGQTCTGFVAPPATGSDLCPFRPTLAWQPICSATSCLLPSLKLSITLVYNPKTSNRKVAFNSNLHQIVLFKGSY